MEHQTLLDDVGLCERCFIMIGYYTFLVCLRVRLIIRTILGNLRKVRAKSIFIK